MLALLTMKATLTVTKEQAACLLELTGQKFKAVTAKRDGMKDFIAVCSREQLALSEAALDKLRVEARETAELMNLIAVAIATGRTH